MENILTGIKPTGIMHIGNYFGAIRPAIEMSQREDARCFYFIADYHALTTIQDAKELGDLSNHIACSWLACGLDPEKVVFYRQSDVPETFELSTILSNVAPKGLLNRAHAYKAIVEKNTENGQDEDLGVNMGLFCYPVLMAADILLMNSKKVPVGKDQKQHVEIARDIAQAFNHKFGSTFVVPSEQISEGVAVVPGLDGRKMSKSYGNTIELFASEAVLKKTISRIVTDSSLPTEPKSTDCAIFNFYKLFATKVEVEKLKAMFESGISWADAKNLLFEKVNSFLSPMRESYEYFRANPNLVNEILRRGAEKARVIAKETIARTRKNIGV